MVGVKQILARTLSDTERSAGVLQALAKCPSEHSRDSAGIDYHGARWGFPFTQALFRTKAAKRRVEWVVVELNGRWLGETGGGVLENGKRHSTPPGQAKSSEPQQIGPYLASKLAGKRVMVPKPWDHTLGSREGPKNMRVTTGVADRWRQCGNASPSWQVPSSKNTNDEGTDYLANKPSPPQTRSRKNTTITTFHQTPDPCWVLSVDFKNSPLKGIQSLENIAQTPAYPNPYPNTRLHRGPLRRPVSPIGVPLQPLPPPPSGADGGCMWDCSGHGGPSCQLAGVAGPLLAGAPAAAILLQDEGRRQHGVRLLGGVGLQEFDNRLGAGAFCGVPRHA